VNARFAKPLDTELILPLAQRIGRVVTLEEGCLVGGFGSCCCALLDADVVASKTNWRAGSVSRPCRAVTNLKQHYLTSPQIAEKVLNAFNTQLSTVNY